MTDDVQTPQPAPQFPEEGILWRGWNDETLGIIREKDRPILLFVADRDPLIAPFLKGMLRAMPANEKLRGLLHEVFVALFVEADAVPDYLKALGAGSRYHIAILSPSGLTPMAVIDPRDGRPEEIVETIVKVLERLRDTW